MTSPTLTAEEVHTLEKWLAEWKWHRARLLPPNIANIISKLCDHFWTTLEEGR